MLCAAPHSRAACVPQRNKCARVRVQVSGALREAEASEAEADAAVQRADAAEARLGIVVPAAHRLVVYFQGCVRSAAAATMAARAANDEVRRLRATIEQVRAFACLRASFFWGLTVARRGGGGTGKRGCGGGAGVFAR